MLYPDPHGAGTTVLITDELCATAAEWDLGWYLGELLELCNDPARVPAAVGLRDHPVADAVRSAYRDGGGDCSETVLGSAMVLRWAVHLHDYAAYVGWVEDFAARWTRLGWFAHTASRALAG